MCIHEDWDDSTNKPGISRVIMINLGYKTDYNCNMNARLIPINACLTVFGAVKLHCQQGKHMAVFNFQFKFRLHPVIAVTQHCHVSLVSV